MFPTNHLKIIDFIRKIIEIAVIFRVQATWSPMAKNLSFWRLRGGSGRLREAPGSSGRAQEAPGRLQEAPGRLQEAPGALLEAPGEAGGG